MDKWTELKNDINEAYEYWLKNYQNSYNQNEWQSGLIHGLNEIKQAMQRIEQSEYFIGDIGCPCHICEFSRGKKKHITPSEFISVMTKDKCGTCGGAGNCPDCGG